MIEPPSFFAFIGGVFTLIGWIILVVPIYGIRNATVRTNELLEELAKQAALTNASLQHPVDQPTTSRPL